ncbi:MAG: HlyD family efflux transporter periplasmic adaptor subunit [Magnetococcales bacterium]|nr:HlyD family efflux transporter periplasmic adaptor subunit [Magnetococcales bacterium]
MSPSLPVEKILQKLNVLLHIEKKARMAANSREVGFLIVNETHTLVPYHQAALWLTSEEPRGRIEALSGLVDPDPLAPFVVWLTRVLRHIASSGERASRLHTFVADDLPESERREWEEWFPVHALWSPLVTPAGQGLGGFVLVRDEEWTESERQVLAHVSESYAYVLNAVSRRKREGISRLLAWRPRQRVKLLLTLMLMASMGLPVRQSALAPAEVVASDPTIVRAPLEGVVDQFRVQPNEPVRSGQPLLNLDDVTLRNRLEVARKTLGIAEAKYRRAAQQAVSDKKSQTELELFKGQLEKQSAEVAYLQQMLAKILIRAPRDGLAVFEDVNEWLGRPVVVGEKILMIADPRQTELAIQLPAKDAISLDPGAEVALFLSIDPEHPVPATLYFASYNPTVTAESVLAYRLKARFNDGEKEPPRIGLQGTAKIYGERVTLFYYLFRRPLAALRQALGV